MTKAELHTRATERSKGRNMVDISNPETRRQLDVMARETSRFMREQMGGRPRCQWQRGCGRFRSVSSELCARHQKFAELIQRAAEKRALRDQAG